MQPAANKRALLVIFLTVFIDLLGFGMVIPLLPVYARLFTDDQTGWVIGALMASFSAMQFLFAPIWGRVSDRVGRRPILVLGLAGSVVFYALFGVASSMRSLTLLFVSRIGAGICGATISTAQAYIADVTTIANRARGMALIGAAFGMGFTFGPLIAAVALFDSAPTVPAASAHADTATEATSRIEGTTHAAEASPWPGYLAASLSAVALGMAIFYLPESLSPNSEHAGRSILSLDSLRAAVAIPSMPLLLVTATVTVLSFANLESTMSLLLAVPAGHFEFDPMQILLVYTFIGLVLSIAQGVLVRRVAGRVPEGTMALVGGVTMIVGYLLVPMASKVGSLHLLLAALFIEVTGFAFLPTALNSLISRRSDPAKQGGILGLNQSMSSLARILGPLIGIRLFYSGPMLPYWSAAILMAGALVLVQVAVRRGRDFHSPRV